MTHDWKYQFFGPRLWAPRWWACLTMTRKRTWLLNSVLMSMLLPATQMPWQSIRTSLLIFFALVLAETFNVSISYIVKAGDGSNYITNIGETYAPLFRPNGIFINVGLPEWNFPEIRPMLLAMSQVTICGSAIGSPAEIEDMLQFAAKTGVKPWIQTYPMSEAPKAVEDFKAGKPRFRFVLKN